MQTNFLLQDSEIPFVVKGKILSCILEQKLFDFLPFLFIFIVLLTIIKNQHFNDSVNSKAGKSTKTTLF